MRNLCILLLLFTSFAQAGVVIGGTRFVFAEKKKGVAVSVFNRSSATYLINSKILRGDIWSGNEDAGGKEAPFVITPPLFSLAAGKENTLRIVQTDNNLPEDRESLFTLSIAAIPPGKTETDNVQMAIRSNLKLFYRPAGLQGKPEMAYQKLNWHNTNEGLTVENTTPYYVTLFNLKVNGKPIGNPGVVAPFSKRKTGWCRERTVCQMAWQTINDYGRVMPPIAKTII